MPHSEDNKKLMQVIGSLLYSRDGWRSMCLGQFVATSETIYFIKRYGWHYYPINAWEFFWDCIAVFLIIRGIYQILIGTISSYGVK